MRGPEKSFWSPNPLPLRRRARARGAGSSFGARITLTRKGYAPRSRRLLPSSALSSSAELRQILATFIPGAAQPALLDPGEEPLRLIPDHWEISEWNGRIAFQAWDDRRNLVCRIAGVKDQRRGRLALFTERFPKTQGEIQIADLAAPEGMEIEKRATRAAFRERFRFMLAREFSEWKLEDLSSEPDLEHSLSPAYIRAMIRRGSIGIAAMATPRGAAQPAGVVAFALVWLDHLRRR